MLDDKKGLQPHQRKDITERFARFIEERNITQAQAGREIGISSTTISEVVHGKYSGKTSDIHLVKLHNWMELTARRDTLLNSREFVSTTVAKEILVVAEMVAETCKMGVVFGPAQIGKSMTLRAIAGDQRYGDPVLIRVNESLKRPLPLCRALCSAFSLTTTGSFDVLMRRLVKRLAGTKRMLIFDEADRLCYRALETVRDLHDEAGCPILLAGKPTVYERLGFRDLGDFSEVTDQLSSRIAIKRDLTERTRGETPEPLFTRDDIHKLIKRSELSIRVSRDAVDWLKRNACVLGNGGIGRALVCLYLATKVAYARGDARIDVTHLEDVASLSMGDEDAARAAETVAEASGMRRVV